MRYVYLVVTRTVRSPVYRSRERMFPVGTFTLRSENAGERKVPEPLTQSPVPKPEHDVYFCIAVFCIL